jgi:hypothetical protein
VGEKGWYLTSFRTSTELTPCPGMWCRRYRSMRASCQVSTANSFQEPGAKRARDCTDQDGVERAFKERLRHVNERYTEEACTGWRRAGGLMRRRLPIRFRYPRATVTNSPDGIHLRENRSVTRVAARLNAPKVATVPRFQFS